MKNVLTSLTLGLGVLVVLMAPKANADSWDQKTLISVNEPVRVAELVLEPGEYVFKLVNSQASRTRIAIYSVGEMHSIGIVQGEQAVRPNHASTGVTFYDRAAGAPRAVRDWFFEGNTNGIEFPAPRTAH